jgi:hypothetical protein
MAYYKRTADALLRDLLDAFGAVLIEGPKWCGKTTTAKQVANSLLELQDPDTIDEYKATAMSKPSLLLQGKTPRLIDEWQDLPMLWDAVRTMVDRRGEPGQFILTGSNSIDQNKIRHSGIGRIATLRMMPMSLWESHESTGEVSLTELFNNPSIDLNGKASNMSIEQLIYAACRGGWPAALMARSEKAQLMVAKNYLNTVCARDVSSVDGVKREEQLTRLILRSYARNISTLAKKSSILADVGAAYAAGCSQDTFDRYVEALQRLFVIQDINAWCPAIRSKTAIRSSQKRCFCDPSIAAAALGQSPQSLQTHLHTFGFIFEQMCIRDLQAYSVGLDSHVAYYHDRYGLEADVVLHLSDGRYALIECKLGSREIDEGAEHLLELQQLIREKQQSTDGTLPFEEPTFLMILTGGKMAYTRADGVKVVPLAVLRD